MIFDAWAIAVLVIVGLGILAYAYLAGIEVEETDWRLERSHVTVRPKVYDWSREENSR